MIVLGVLFLLFLILAFLLLTPFEIQIDTLTGNYRLRWRGIASARLAGEADEPLLRLWLMGWRKELSLWDLAVSSGKREEREPKSRKKEGWKRPRWLTWRFALRLLQTFRVKIFRLQIDSDDYVLNAWLFPLFYRFSAGRRQLNINFSGRNELELYVTNRIWNVLWVFITGILKIKK